MLWIPTDTDGAASPARRSPACPGNDFSDMVFEESQINCTFEEQQGALPEDLGSISGEWVSPGEHSKGGLTV